MSAPPGIWVCRVCGRRVPRRVDECFCGARREQMLTLQQRDAERSGRRIPFAVVLPLLLVGLVAAYGLHLATRDDEDAGRSSSGAATAPAPSPIPPSPALATAPAGVANPADAGPARPAPAALDWPSRDVAPATPEPTLAPRAEPMPNAPPDRATPPPPEVDQREQAKAAALDAYATALQRLTGTASRMAQRVRAYQADCVGQRLIASITNCRDLEASIRRALTDVETGLEAAEDQARRSWVEPGRLRDARSQTFFGSRDWEDLLRAARQLRP